MAKNFDRSVSAKAFGDVGRASAEKAKVIVLENIHTDNLVDHADNGESMETLDLEFSILENGFTDPLEVTSFGMDRGKYLILSGRRRRAAGVRCGYTVFPCIVKNNINSVFKRDRYVLDANKTRDSENDPLLQARRYRKEKALLESSGFKGNYLKEIGERMNLSPSQVQRKDAMSRVVVEGWNMVAAGIAGESSVVPLAAHAAEDQQAIIVMFKECVKENGRLTRDMAQAIVDGYRRGERSYKGAAGPSAGGPSANGGGESPDSPKAGGFSGDGGEEGCNEGLAGIGRAAPGDAVPGLDRKAPDAPDAGGGAVPSARNAKSIANGQNVIKCIAKLDACLQRDFSFINGDEAQSAIKSMASLFSDVVWEMHNLSAEYGLTETLAESVDELMLAIEQCAKKRN